MMTPTNVFMALVLAVAIAWILLALILRFLPWIFEDFKSLDERTLWGKVGTYIKKSISGVFSPDTRYLFSEGHDLLKHNFLLPIVAYLATVPMAVWQFDSLYKSFPGISEMIKLKQSGNWRNMALDSLLLFILEKAHNHLVYSLGNLAYVLTCFMNYFVFLVAFIISIFLFRSLRTIDPEKYRISPELKKFFSVLIILFSVTTIIEFASMIPLLHEGQMVEQDGGQLLMSIVFWNSLVYGPILTMTFGPFLTCSFYFILISQVQGTKLDKKSFWQNMTHSFMPVLYLSIFSWFVNLNFLSIAESFTHLYRPGGHQFYSENSPFFRYFLKDIVTLFNFFFLPFPVVVIMHKLGFWGAVSKLKSWHLKYPERIAGFLISSWIILFAVSVALDALNYLLRLQGIEFWLEVFGMEFRKIVLILVSSWLVLCMIQLVKELHETDTGAGDERDYFEEAAQDPSPAGDQPS